VKTYKGDITRLEPHQIFVFGSNTEGRHGMGAALWAKKNAGAIQGQAKGRQGQSYAIVTKDLTKGTHPSVPRSEIMAQISFLYGYAFGHYHEEFIIPYKGEGTNLNSYTPKEMAEMFVDIEITALEFAEQTGWEYPGIPPNLVFEEEFWKLIQEIRTEKGLS
jgi:hypothetical protein